VRLQWSFGRRRTTMRNQLFSGSERREAIWVTVITLGLASVVWALNSIGVGFRPAIEVLFVVYTGGAYLLTEYRAAGFVVAVAGFGMAAFMFAQLVGWV
jgi:hypothetical protein